MTEATIKARRREFRSAAKEHFKARVGTSVDPREAWAVTNGAYLLEGGIQIGVVNFERGLGEATASGLSVVAMLRLPLQDEFFFSILIKSDIDSFAKALELVPGRRNNTRIYLRNDGKVYCSDKYLESLEVPPDELGPSVTVDRVAFALYPPFASAGRSGRLRDLLGLFIAAVGPAGLDELNLWEDIPSTSTPMPSDVSIGQLNDRIRTLGGYFGPGLVERYHTALNFLPEKHFVILKGVSGTGKTLLAKYYAFAVHGFDSASRAEVEDRLFFIDSVRPEWTNPLGFLGHVDVITQRYEVTPFVRALLVAHSHSAAPIFFCLDEMNVAQVEYYFADVLSAMESHMPLELHGGLLPLEGTGGEAVPGSITLPPNLYITGTINSDESTRPLSDKVLDRAQVIDMSEVDMPGYIRALQIREPALAPAAATCEPLLTWASASLAAEGLGFGYRLAREVIAYIESAERLGTMSQSGAIDAQLAQKVLVKLRGSERQRPLLEALSAKLAGYPTASALLSTMQGELDEFGSFQVTR